MQSVQLFNSSIYNIIIVIISGYNNNELCISKEYIILEKS